MEGPLDGFFELPEGYEPEPVTEIAPEVVEDTAPESTEVQDDTVTEQEPTTQNDERDHRVPVAALREEREKARAAKEEADTLRQRLAEFEASQTASNLPDPYDQPAEYHAMLMQQVRQQVALETAHANLNQSRARALEKYGEETINEVADWADEHIKTNPGFEGQVLSQIDPVEWVINQKRNADLLKSFQADPDAYVRQRAMELGLAETATSTVAPAQATMARKPTGPLSLNSAKSRDVAAKSTIVTGEDVFNGLFKN